MTQTTQTILEKYQVRKTKKQKEVFREYAKSVAEDNGYSVNIENGYLGAKNIVIGDVDDAKVIYTAHYDTCPRFLFPNFITPKNIFIYIIYQLVLVLVLFAILVPVWLLEGFLLGLLSGISGFDIPDLFISLAAEIPIIAILCLALFGPANKHTANDNTSGVTTLLDIMQDLPEDERKKVAFVFFDLEETGLWGSAGFASKHKKIRKNTLVINFDCVSDGNNFLLVVKKDAANYKKVIEDAFQSNEDKTVEVISKGAFYPSDQANFKCGVGVAALKKAKNSKLLYMNRIHTNKDVIYQEENIEFLKNASVELVKKI